MASQEKTENMTEETVKAKTAETCTMSARESGNLNATQRKREGGIKVELEGCLFNYNCGLWSD